MATKVLMFHHVSRRPGLAFGPAVSCRVTPDEMRSWIEGFADHSIIEWDAIYAAPSDRDHLVLTFDDGWLDFMTEALPVLEALEAPCILFVVTGWLDGTSRPMEHDLAWIASRLDDPGEGEALYRRELGRLLRLSATRRDDALERLAAEVGAPYPPPLGNTLLSWDHVRALDEHPLVTIGSHSVSHTTFGLFDSDRARREALSSKARLEAVLGHEVACFAYPYGRHRGLVPRAVASAGYRLAFTTRPRLVPAARSFDPMRIPRFDVNARPDAREREGRESGVRERVPLAAPSLCPS